MRIVGEQNRSEIELDPVKAYRRGGALDVLLRGAHGYFNRLDAKRQVLVARAVNAAWLRMIRCSGCSRGFTKKVLSTCW